MSASLDTAIRVGAASSSTRAAVVIRARESTTTRSGWTASGTPRTARCGSSASSVPEPTTTASASARSRCTSARDSAEVIQRLLPSAAAIRPSSVAAYFQRTKGRPRRTDVSHATLTAAASSASSPLSTSTPAARSVAAPPDAAGLGSDTACTTRATPASISAWAHGPVLPVWLHGSSVTTAVPPRAASPAARSACTSACGPCGLAVPALADDGAGRVEDHTADDGVGGGGAEGARGQRDRSAHRVGLIGGGHRVLLPHRARTPGQADVSHVRRTAFTRA